MRPAAFDLVRPATVAEALAAMNGGARPLAGGQSLLQAMRLRDAEPECLVDLSVLDELDDAITCAEGSYRIGALATHHALQTHAGIAATTPWLTEAARLLGDVQVRNLGTAVGNLCWADPRANLAVAMLASGVEVACATPDGERRIPIDDFFTGFRRTALNGNALALAVEGRVAADARGVYLEFSRQPQDLALVNVCVVRSGDTTRVAVGGIDPVPVRLPAVEADGIAALGAALAPDVHQPIADHYGDAAYKLHLADVLVRRAFAQLERAA